MTADLARMVADLPPERRILLERLLHQQQVDLARSLILRRRGDQSSARLSFPQRRLWLIHQLDPGSPAYNLPLGVRLQGSLDVTVLRSVLEEIVRRHEALRTCFVMSGEEARQVILSACSVPFPVVDLTALPPVQREGEARHLADREAARPFDLATGPVLRALLLRLALRDHVALLTLHHIAADGWSLDILMREIESLYPAFLAGAPSPLPELPIQYADFAEWQRNRLDGEKLDAEIAYWRERLAGAPPVLDLPFDRLRPAIQNVRGSRSTFELPHDLSTRLRALGQRLQATPYMVLLAGFQALLGRASGQRTLVVGTPASGRQSRETEDLIGFFVNTLAIRCDLDEATCFLALAGQVREAVLAAQSHQNVPFEQLVEELDPERSLAHAPIFQQMFSFQSSALASLAGGPQPSPLGGLTLQPVAGEAGTSRFDLTLEMTERGGGFAGVARYQSALFDAPTVQRLLGHFRVLLEGAVAHPEAPLQSLPLLTAAELQQWLEWNDTVTAWGEEVCAHELFERQVERSPEAVALISGEQRLGFRELDVRAELLARHLRALGVAAEVRVGILLERSFDLVIALLGALKAGGAYVPLDPGHPPGRLADLLADSQAAVLLTEGRLLASLPELPGGLKVVRLDSGWDAGTLPERAPRRVRTDHLAYVMYTSGSTGHPKGVMISHRALANYLRWSTAAYLGQGGGAALLYSSIAFDLTLTSLWCPLLTGQPLAVAPQASGLPELASRLRDKPGYGLLKITPAHLEGLGRLLSPGEAAGSASVFVVGGEALRGESLSLWSAAAPGARIINEYGPTETVVGCCVYTVRPGEPALRGPVPIGRPIANTRIYLLDRDLNPVPVRGVGELYVGGSGVGRGYSGRPDLTAERFVPDAWSGAPGERLYRTGDLARFFPDGNLELLGRIDDQVKIRGFRIEPGEIEAALAAHPGIREALVTVHEDASGNRRLVAYLTALDGRPAPEEIRGFLRGRLPEPMVPSAFVFLERLPVTANGKVDRRALPRAEEHHLQAGADFEAPRGPVEEVVAAIWGEVLHVEPIGRRDNFFALGGHSLLAVQVLSRLRGAFEIELALRTLFEKPTVAELGERVQAALQEQEGAPPAPPVVRVPRDGELSLSFAQQRLWFLDRLEPGSAAYNIPVALRLEGPLDAAALAASFSEIVRRHEVLRTSFILGAPDEPVQVIAPPSPCRMPLVDLSALPAEARVSVARRLAGQEARRPFDLSRGPVLRLLLLRMDGEEHVLATTVHHIASDGWSMGILVREASALYEACTARRSSPLPELAVQYADFAAWQRGWLQGEVLGSELTYWHGRLADLPPLLELSTDRPRPPVQSLRGATRPFVVPSTLAESLRRLGRQRSATLFMVLLAGFQALLARSSGQMRIAVGTPVAGRTRREIEELIGFFVNTLVLRGDLSADPSFTELLEQAREVALEAYAHQDVPFEKLVEALQPERSLSHSPVFQVMLALQSAQRPAAGAAAPSGLRMALLGGDTGTAKLDLSLSLLDGGAGLSGMVEYATDLFDATTIQRLADRFVRHLETAVADPLRRISGLALLGEAERWQLLGEWNDTGAAPEEGLCLHELFEEQARRDPAAIALISGAEQVSYGDLDSRANRLAHELRVQSVRTDVPVAVFCERGVDLIVSILGALKAGGGYFPLDPAYPPERLATMLEDARARVLVTRESLLARLPGDPQGVRDLSVVCLDRDQGRIEQRGGARPEPLATSASLAYLMYTSGTTGRPKGVMIPHRAAAWYAAVAVGNYGIAPGDRLLQLSSISFDISVEEIFACLAGGATLVFPSVDAAFDARRLLAECRAAEVSVISSPTAFWHELVPEAVSHPELVPGSLRLVILGGEKVLPERVARWQHSLGERVALVNSYGPTEATVAVALYPVSGPWPRTLEVPLGRPIPGARVYVLDPSLRPQPAGVPGELFIGGAGVARGYLGCPDLTSERFVPDPFGGAGGRLYRTGDRIRWRADGLLEFLGRVDGQVKVRGFRVEPGEIEAALASHPAIREAVAVAREVAPGDRRLVAYLVAREGRPAPEEIRDFLRDRLPEPMVPSAFVFLERLPLTPNGKVDHRALPPPEQLHLEAGADFAAPSGLVEETVAAIWAEVLRVERIGRRDSFFALGGHSLLAVQVVSRLREAFGVELALRALFERQTVATIGELVQAVLREQEGTPAPPIAQVPREGELPLSFAQQRLWFLDRLEPGSAAYNIPAALRLEGALDVAALAASFSEIARRHEALRTSFTLGPSDEPVQVIAPPSPCRMPLVDLSALPAAAQAPVARGLVGEEARRPFDLSRGPVLRLLLLRTDGEEHVLAATVHHIASDGWSMGILVREASALYEACAARRPSPLPELAVQYADFAAWQRGWLQGEVLDAELAYWRGRLADLPPLLELATDRPRPPVQSLRGATRSFTLPDSLAESLRRLGRQRSATLFMVLLAGFQTLLARSSGQTRITVGTPVAGRTRREIEDLIGFFVNTLVLRGDLSADPSFVELLEQAREVALEAYAHQDVPFEKLVEVLQPERSLAHSPLFQVLFTLQTAPPPRRAPRPGPGLRMAPLRAGETGTAKLDLSLSLLDGGTGLAGSFEYAVDLFDAATIQRLADCFARLLEGAMAEPSRRISELALLGESERWQLVGEWGQAASLQPRLAGLYQLFAEQALRRPQAVALSWAGQELTHGELRSHAAARARVLRRLGVAPEVRVGVLLDRTPELVISLLAVLAAGGAYVPLDPAYPAERVAFMLEDSGAAVVVTRRDLRERVKGTSAHVLCLEDEPETGGAEPPATPVLPGNLAYLIYTSGSTGVPKGVPITHENVVPLLLWSQEAFGFGEHTRALQTLSPAFDFGVFEVLTTLLSGGTLFLLGEAEHGDVERYLQEIRRHEVNTLHATPSFFRAVAAAAVAAGERLSTLEVLHLGGEALTEGLVEEAFTVAGDECRLFNGYGPTEAAINCALFEVGRAADRHPRGLASVPIGRPSAASRLYVLDRRLQPVPVGVPGELLVGGVGLSRGYLGRPGQTAARFIPDPFGGPGERLYRTGDLVRFRGGGVLEFLGRIDDQVKIRGFRIELGEIETALGQLAGVKEAVVVVREDAPGDRRLVAYVVAAGEPRPGAGALRDGLRSKLPEHMVPSIFVPLERLPLTPNGKVDHRALPPPGAGALPAQSGASVSPGDDLEATLLQIWEEVLGVRPIGVTDDFFALGGHSLLAVRLIAQIERQLDVELPINALFQRPTVRRLAILLRQTIGRSPQSRPVVVPLRSDGSGQPLFLVHPVGGHVFSYRELAQRLEGLPVYGIQAPEADPEGRLAQIETMAAEYLREVRSVQPTGPYRLGGWSLGATIAFEMARQMEADGEAVEFLGLIDPAALLLGSRFRFWLMGWQRRLAGRRHERQRIRAFLHDLEGLQGILPSEVDEARRQRLFSIFQRNLDAYDAYRALSYRGRLSLFITAGRLALAPRSSALGWHRVVTGAVDVHPVPGNHFSVLKSPQVEVLAERLAAAIRKPD